MVESNFIGVLPWIKIWYNYRKSSVKKIWNWQKFSTFKRHRPWKYWTHLQNNVRVFNGIQHSIEGNKWKEYEYQKNILESVCDSFIVLFEWGLLNYDRLDLKGQSKENGDNEVRNIEKTIDYLE